MARRAGVAQPNLSKWERGRREPSAEWQAKVWETLLRMTAERRASEETAA